MWKKILKFLSAREDLPEVATSTPGIVKEDLAHIELQKDVASLLNDIRSYEFHDFKNSAYSLPKVALIERLQAIILKAKEGKYDN